MIRTSPETTRRVQRIAHDEYGGISADETIQRLLDEHWKATALAAVRHAREHDPDDWAAYVDQVDTDAQADADITDEWHA